MTIHSSLVCHVEKYLGEVQAAWTLLEDGLEAPFSVVRCAGKIENTAIFCTLGLSGHPQQESTSQNGLPIRHELLIAVPDGYDNRNFPALLQQLGIISLKRQRAFLRGEAIGGSHPIFGGSSLKGFYASSPSFVSDNDFEIHTLADDQHVVFVWMAPLYRQEIEFVRAHGWNQFEDILLAKETDLVELDRECTVSTN